MKPPTLDVMVLGQGPCTVVAVHGIQGTRASWLPLAERLANQARWVLPNLRGRGQALRGRSGADYSLAAFAAELRDVIEAYAVPDQPLVLAGWSMGVSVCLEYALQALGPRPARMLLLSGTARVCEAPWFHAQTHEALQAEAVQRQQRLDLAVAADPEAVAWTWQALRHTDHRSQLPRLSMPVQVVHGQADTDSPWVHALALTAGLPNAELLGLEAAGHSILATHTDAVAEATHRFLSPLSQLV